MSRGGAQTGRGVLGIHEVHILGYQDRELAGAPSDEIRRSLVALIRRHRPTVVLTFDQNGFNQHPDHMAISRFTIDAVSAAGDPRWEPSTGEPHVVSRVLWTAPVAVWEAARQTDLSSQPGVDFLIDVSPWRSEGRCAESASHSAPLIDRYFFSQPDVDRILGVEVFRQAWGQI